MFKQTNFKSDLIFFQQKEQENCKWRKVSEPLTKCPLDPLKVTEVNQIFLGGLKHVNNP